MRNQTVEVDIHKDHHCFTKRISWSAILVGALVGVGLGFLLNLLGVALGLTALAANSEGVLSLVIGGAIGTLIAMFLALVPAGYAAGYLGRKYCPNRNLGILYGFLTWTLSLIICAAVTAHISSYVSEYSSTIVGYHMKKSVATSENSDKTSATTSSERTTSTKAQKELAGTAALGSFALFMFFLFGALFTCIGASWGMSCKRDD